MPILVAYAGDDGSTRETAESISSYLAEDFPPTKVLPLTDVNPSVIPTYTAIVIGSTIHDTQWLPNAIAFLHDNSTALAEVPIYAFSVGAPAAMPKFIQGQWQKSEEKKIAQAIEKELKVKHPVLRGHKLFNENVEKEHAGRYTRAFFTRCGDHFGDAGNWKDVQKWAKKVAEDLRKPREKQGNGD
ncbi:uncharacterized protein BDZ99DRAFT_140595 [Mytilinidion resinicola]|uniref:Flavodoxin-like domain-containing protein n=1 Tax=Mytilinidion resinicola TaxID=574789 RepID=A0A6A6Z6B4_9PEZI|nr:uncharacterized protein BDZ99DRAFT_140595 [Mytilinidion resinicola]KAF2816641.1 hypothetical protein BDZ99DRAFT_140595 [Mytilinidion resinicola]